MFERFLKMIEKFGQLAGYLLVKCETKTLSQEDVLLAQAVDKLDCTLVNIISGTLEETPDLEFLQKEALNAIAFDLGLDPIDYKKALGFEPVISFWGDDDDDELDDDTIERLR